MAGEYEVADNHEDAMDDAHEAAPTDGDVHSPAEGELTEEVGHYEDGAHEAPFPPFDPDYFMPQLVWLVITFGALYLLMSRLALPRVAGIIESRRERIAGDLGKANDLNEEAEKAQAEYEQALADARAKAHTIAGETRDKMKAETEELRAETDAKLEDQLAAAEKRIAETKEKAMANVRGVAGDVAGAIVQQITGDNADEGSISGAVDAVMAKGRS